MVGLPVARKDLLNLLMSKFGNVDVMDIEEARAPSRQARIVVRTDPDAATRAEIGEFVDALDIGVPVEIRVASAKRRFGIPKGHDPMFVWAPAQPGCSMCDRLPTYRFSAACNTPRGRRCLPYGA